MITDQQIGIYCLSKLIINITYRYQVLDLVSRYTASTVWDTALAFDRHHREQSALLKPGSYAYLSSEGLTMPWDKER
eukprot:SAG11_NODE_23067_length_395_cov_3.104730_1_plen_76_part_01